MDFVLKGKAEITKTRMLFHDRVGALVEVIHVFTHDKLTQFAFEPLNWEYTHVLILLKDCLTLSLIAEKVLIEDVVG